MKPTEQTLQEAERAIRKIAEKFPDGYSHPCFSRYG